MKVLFATTHSYLPQTAGGSESLTHDLCLSLKEQGIDCAVLAELAPTKDAVWLKGRIKAQLTAKAYPADHRFGYPVYRGWGAPEGVKEVCGGFRPDLVVIQAGVPLLFVGPLLMANIKTVVYLHDVGFHKHGGQYKPEPLLSFLANSQFTADAFKQNSGLTARVMLPIVRTERYRVIPKKQKVVFICPMPIKGVDIAFSLAEANPDIPFLFVESWPIPPEQKQSNLLRAKRCPNIEWSGRQTDMRSIYAQAKILLAPSICHEAWGRVVTESQASGIPTLASDRGGLPESVGSGGMLLDPEADIGVWNRALRSLWHDQAIYEAYSNRAIAHANREAIQPAHLLAEWVAFLDSL